MCGDREWTDEGPITLIIDGYQWAARFASAGLLIIEGEARGADRIARKYAERCSVAVERYPAKWVPHGDAAGPLRNQQMLDEGKPDVVWAFHDNLVQSKGTRDMVLRARLAGLPVYLVSRLP